jgi:hypothetical protein
MRACLNPHMCGFTERCMHRSATRRMRLVEQHNDQ